MTVKTEKDRQGKATGYKITGFRAEIDGVNQPGDWLHLSERGRRIAGGKRGSRGYFYLSYRDGRIYAMRPSLYKNWDWRFDNECLEVSFVYHGEWEGVQSDPPRCKTVRHPVAMRFVDRKTYRFVKEYFDSLVPMKPAKLGKAKDLLAKGERLDLIYRKNNTNRNRERLMDQMEIMSFSKAKAVQAERDRLIQMLKAS